MSGGERPQQTASDMNPLEIIQKWITEHGSAAILRERVAILKDHVAGLERENSALKDQLAECQARTKELQSQADVLSEKIKALTDPRVSPAWGSQPRIGGRMG